MGANGKRIESFAARSREPFGWQKPIKKNAIAMGPSRPAVPARQLTTSASSQPPKSKAK